MQHPNNKTSERQTFGFTLIELMLAMAFFSAILGLSAATFVQVLGVYNKGVVVKQMNQAGRTLTDSLIRNANHNHSSVTFYPGSGVNTARCIKLGSTTYLLSYAADETIPAPASTYRFSDTYRPVNFVRYNAPDQACPVLPGGLVSRADVSPVTGDTLRVYRTDITPVAGESKLLRFRVTLGTFTGIGASNNPVVAGSSITCPLDSFGNFCAFSTYETVLYLPNNEGGI